MNIRAKMLKVAENLMEDLVKSFEMTEDEWKEYSELHPAAKRENHTIIPNRKNQGGNGGDRITDEQKKIHERVVSDSNHYSDNRIVRLQIDSFLRGKKIHPLTLDYLSDNDNEYLRRTIAKHPNTSKKTLEKLSKDKVYGVREMVAENPKTSSETLEKLSDDENLLVVLSVYNNPRLPEKIRKKLSKRDFLQEIIDFK